MGEEGEKAREEAPKSQGRPGSVLVHRLDAGDERLVLTDVSVSNLGTGCRSSRGRGEEGGERKSSDEGRRGGGGRRRRSGRRRSGAPRDGRCTNPCVARELETRTDASTAGSRSSRRKTTTWTRRTRRRMKQTSRSRRRRRPRCARREREGAPVSRFVRLTRRRADGGGRSVDQGEEGRFGRFSRRRSRSCRDRGRFVRRRSGRTIDYTWRKTDEKG